MKTLHLAPGFSAGRALRQSIRAAARDEEVLACPDDLSCGPIDSENKAARIAWWGQFHDGYFIEPLAQFWGRVTTTDDRLVIWFARHSAVELAFFLALADRLGDRAYDIVDATAAAQAVSIIPPDRLRTMFGSERPITKAEKEEARRQWHRLRVENAAFRVVTPEGLASAP